MPRPRPGRSIPPSTSRTFPAIPDAGEARKITAAARASEWGEAGPKQAEFITFGIGQDMPRLLPRLADVGQASTELEQAFELGVLIAVGGVDVDVQPGFPLLRLIPATEDDRWLRTAEPFARPDLQRAVVLAIEHDEAQNLAPEPRQHLRVAATEHELTDPTCH